MTPTSSSKPPDATNSIWASRRISDVCVPPLGPRIWPMVASTSARRKRQHPYLNRRKPISPQRQAARSRNTLSDQAASVALPTDAPRAEVPAAPLPSVDPTARATALAAAMSRLDAGMAPSTTTQVIMTGDQWRMEQAVVAHDDQGLNVAIDMGRTDRRIPKVWRNCAPVCAHGASTLRSTSWRPDPHSHRNPDIAAIARPHLTTP